MGSLSNRDSRLKITERLCKTALSKTQISSFDYTINPYTGCQNGCVYCYANFIRRFSGHFRDAWGSFVDAKVNLLEVLGKELPRKAGGRIWLSSVCDPYQPMEKKYELSRGAIELVSRYGKFSLSILTKNALVLRDLDLLKRMGDRVDVGFTITTFSSETQSVFEPHASPVRGRIKTLRRLNEAGINTWVFIAPILPYATEEGLEQGLQRVAEAGVKRLMTDRYNARGMIIRQTLQAYRRWRPNIDLQGVRELLWHGDKYYRQLDKRIALVWQEVATGSTHEAVF
jgi:DNA repair photolyase